MIETLKKAFNYTKLLAHCRSLEIDNDLLKKEVQTLKEKIKEILYDEVIIKPNTNERLKAENRRLRLHNKELKSLLKDKPK